MNMTEIRTGGGLKFIPINCRVNKKITIVPEKQTDTVI